MKPVPLPSHLISPGDKGKKIVEHLKDRGVLDEDDKVKELQLEIAADSLVTVTDITLVDD